MESTRSGSGQLKEGNSAKPWKKISFLSFGIIIVIGLIVFLPKKIENHMSTPNTDRIFNKQGVLTLTKRDGTSIVTIDIEIADNDKKREIGLMDRPSMEERQGMLFIFDEEYMASFWMRNTILSLDMIFINKQGEIVTIQKNTKPFSDDSYSATAPTLFVLEVNAGFSEKYGIKEGDRIQWKRL